MGLRLAERMGGRRRQREGVTAPLRGTPRLLSRGALAGTRRARNAAPRRRRLDRERWPRRPPSRST